MKSKKTVFLGVVVIILSIFIPSSSVKVFAQSSGTQSIVLLKGMEGKAVTSLQKDLKTLGFFNVNTTGYYGCITKEAVKRLQKKYGLKQDGITGINTYSVINKLMKRDMSSSITSRGTEERDNYLIPWFGGVENIFKRGMTATVHDVETGLNFKIMRTYGYNHADCEPLTLEDTKIMKRIYGGEWSWGRRAIIVTVNGKKIAASMAGMPHAGVDSAAANAYVKWRSEGYGAGDNLDTVKNNGMDGHFDVHFLGSKTHGTSKVDGAHQSMVKKAAQWAAKNY